LGRAEFPRSTEIAVGVDPREEWPAEKKLRTHGTE
jgi:hypothetical protein